MMSHDEVTSSRQASSWPDCDLDMERTWWTNKVFDTVSGGFVNVIIVHVMYLLFTQSRNIK